MKTKILIPVIISSFFILPSAFGQGSLTPPSAPGPTMVTLSQIEPRTPISSAPYTISQPGSYYLTTNLTVSGGSATNAITIAANGVTLDLCGFTIFSTAAPTAGAAIWLSGTLTNIAIDNGNISSGVATNGSGGFSGNGFLDGIYASALPSNVRVKNISVTGVQDEGIFVGAGGGLNSTLVESCAVTVAGGEGIVAGTVFDSTALIIGETGVFAQWSVENSYASSLNATGISTENTAENCYGISGGSANGISAATAENCYGSSAGGDGIGGTTAENCYGLSTGAGAGIDALTAENCYGSCPGSGTEGSGVNAFLAIGCRGASTSAYGIYAAIAQNCYGTSSSGTGLNAYAASVSAGFSSTGTGLNVVTNINSFSANLGLY